MLIGAIRNTAILSLIPVVIFLSACSQNKKEVKSDIPAKRTAAAESLFKQARASLNKNDYEGAIKRYETLEAQYPLGKFAQQALLEQAYAYYKFEEPDNALDMIDRFTDTYPNSPKVDYALYLRGLVNFARGASLIDKVFPRQFSDLDNVKKKEAFQDFAKLLTRYPESSYAPDARKRMNFLKNNVASGETNVAKYYYQRGAYLAAFNRAEYAIKHYQGTPAIVNALDIKVCAAQKLGKTQIANDTLRVLKLNFPTKGNVNCP